jgi:hypothetical protein
MGKKKKKGGDDSAFGLALIGFSLVMDAVTGGLQDKVKTSTKELNPDGAHLRTASLAPLRTCAKAQHARTSPPRLGEGTLPRAHAPRKRSFACFRVWT